MMMTIKERFNKGEFIMKIKVNAQEVERVVEELLSDVGFLCHESSQAVLNIGSKQVQIVVTKDVIEDCDPTGIMEVVDDPLAELDDIDQGSDDVEF